MNNTMTYKGFNAQIMEAVRLRGEGTFELPTGTALPVFPSEAFVSYPEAWMRGPGVFVIPVRPDKGLWFNWRMNSEINTAIIPTVKGCNPITGLQTSGFHLEKYETKCPKHGCDFMAERFCPECNYKWPDRNYVSMSPSWWDGFRADDGTVRQFFFSEDELRDIATHMIGKENTVPAFGFAFYSPKEPRIEQTGTLRGITYNSIVYDSQPQYIYLSNSLGSSISDGSLSGTSFPPAQASYCCSSANVLGASLGEVKTSGPIAKGRGFSKSLSKSASPVPCAGSPVEADLSHLLERSWERSVPVKEVSIGAGAKIRQALNADTYPLDSWCDTPDAVMTIYFVFQEKFEELKSGGMRDLDGVKEGMLAQLPVG